MAEQDIVGRVTAVFDIVDFLNGANRAQQGMQKFAESADKSSKQAANKIKANLAPAQQAIAQTAKAASSTPKVGASSTPPSVTGTATPATSTPATSTPVRLTRAQIAANAALNQQNQQNAKAQRAQKKHLDMMARLEEEAYREDARRTARQVRLADAARGKLIREGEREEARLRREARRQARAEAEAEGKRQRQLTLKLNKEARDEKRRLDAAQRREDQETFRDNAAVQRLQNRMINAPAAMQASILGAVQGPQAVAMRRTLMASGMSRMQALAFQAQQVQGINRQTATWLAGGGGVRPPQFGGRGPGGMGPGGGGFLGRLGRFGASFASGIGMGVGFAGAGLAAGAAQATVEAAKNATAYDRQRIAADNLAGSQAQLNALLEAYGEASGGAVDKVTTLASVTRLMATGFARNAEDVEKIVCATRGASIAMGKPQDYILQETQLAVSNTSFRRLDQIGLGIEEVQTRMEELRAANKELTREEAFRQSVLGLLDQKYGKLSQTIEGQATGIEKLAVAWSNLMLAWGQGASGPMNAVSEKLAKILDHLTKVLELENKLRQGGTLTAEEAGSTAGQDAAERVRTDRFVTNENRRFFDTVGLTDLWQMISGRTDTQVAAQRALQDGTFRFQDRGDSGYTDNRMPTPYQRPEEQMAVIRDYNQRFADLERDWQQRRTETIEQYESERTDIVANYAKQRVREEEDFAIQRARAQRDYERNIMEVLRDAREREADMQEDLDERIADLRENSEERIADMQEKYNKDREKAEKDHRDRLMKAAGQLDAIAVLEERKRFAEENRERKESHDEAIKEQQESLAEQIEEAREAHAEQLEEAREADEKRLEDMRIARAQQIKDEDEDRALRLKRMQEDHEDQLEEFDRQHVLRLKQIDENARLEREKLNDEFMKDLHEVDVYIAGYMEKLKKRDEAMEKWFDNFLDGAEAKLRGENEGGYRYDPVKGPMIPTDYGAALTATSNIAYGAITNSRVVNVQPGAIQVTAQPGMEIYVAGIIEEQLIEIFGDY